MKRFFARSAVVVLASLAPVTMRAVGAPSQTAHARVAKGSAAKPAAHVDHASVGLGGNVDYSLDVTTTSDDPVVTSPSPGKIPGFELIGWGSSVRPTLIKHDGKVQQVTAITITYRLRAKTLGTHVLGPGHFNVDGTRVDAPTVIVQVVPAASAPPATKAPIPRDPFDDLFFDPEPAPAPPPKVVAPSDPLAMVDAVPTAPRDRMVFVRLAVDDDKPIVGAQMTAKLFIYRRRDVSIDGIKHAPGFADFHLLELNNPEKDWHPITIGGETWAYARLRTYAAFPLRSGKLTVEPGEIEMRAVLGGGFVSGEEEDHTTNALEIEAVEPPTEGRPAGYLLGDVASALEVVADANPRVVTDGHALLTLKMRGTGRIDALHVNLPTTPGVHWTTTGDDVRTSVDGATVRGARKVSVDVALDNPGDVALGDAVFHVWDPTKKSYATVKASLGNVRVDGVATAPSTSSSARDLGKLPPPRTDEGVDGEASTLADRPWTWGVVLAAPLVVLLAQGGMRLGRRLRRRVDDERQSPEFQARSALREARAARKRDDERAACAAMMRAIDRALEATVSVRARALTQSELRRALDATSLPRELVGEIATMMTTLESARFATGAMPSVEKCSELVEEILRHRSRAASESASTTERS